jgi:hypothetical protein
MAPRTILCKSKRKNPSPPIRKHVTVKAALLGNYVVESGPKANADATGQMPQGV